MPQIPIFVINLDSTPDRLDKVAVQLSKLSLTFERISAVNGAALSTAEKAAICPPRDGHIPYANGEIGTYMSHLKVFQTIVDRQFARTLVLEDDVEFDNDMIDWVQSTSPFPHDADILKLEGILRPKTMALPIFNYQGRTVVFSRLTSFGAAAYIITQEGARKALRSMAQMKGPIDLGLFQYWKQGLIAYEVQPFPIRQDRRFSLVESERAFIAKSRRKKKTLFTQLNKELNQIKRFIFWLKHFGFGMFHRVPISSFSTVAVQKSPCVTGAQPSLPQALLNQNHPEIQQ